jgi:hypothetical protein
MLEGPAISMTMQQPALYHMDFESTYDEQPVKQHVQLIAIASPSVQYHFLIQGVHLKNNGDVMVNIQCLERNAENMVLLKGLKGW